MSKREGQDYAEYMRVTADERNRIVRLRDLKLALPAVNVFDSPVRCFKVNHEWWKIIHGAVSLLLELDAWQNADDESYSGIQQILEFLEGMDCFDCDDVENCLDTSPTITTIETNITNVTNTTIQNSTDIDILENSVYESNQTDGNLYPSYPASATEPDAACGAAYYVVAKCREFIVDVEAATGTYATLQEAIEAYLVSVISLIFSPFYVLLAAIFSPVPPLSVLTDFDNQASDMQAYLYCNGFDKAEFETYVRTLTNGNAIADFIACIGLGSWNSWIAIGSTDDTQDCSAFCPAEWCYEWNVLSGNLADWTPTAPFGTPRGIYHAGEGWGANPVESAYIYLEMPFPQAANVTSVHVESDNTPDSYWDLREPQFTPPYTNRVTNQGAGGNHTFTVDWNTTGLGIGYNNSPNDASAVRWSLIRVRGNGANPFGADNC